MHNSLIPQQPDLTESENLELIELLRKPVLARWFSLIEQDIVNEDRLAGIPIDQAPDAVKAAKSYTVGKLEVVATLANAINQANPK